MAQVWQAGPDDAETVARLLVEFRDWWGRDWPSDNSFWASVERLMDDPGTAFLLGAPDDDSAPAGVVQLRFRFGVWHAAEDCWLEDLYVREDSRGAGLGAALVEAALEHARHRGCARMELDVNEANPAALALYEGAGFSSMSDPPGGRNLLMGRALRG